MQLTEQQQQAVDNAKQALTSGKKLYKIGGAAGTGKSTILKSIIEDKHDVGVCAFAGKAASVLRNKGILGATTIHKKIYNWDGKRFNKRPTVPWGSFVLDEGSMVGTNLYNDLKSYNLPIIAIGDHYQLEPVGSGTLNLMKDLDSELTEVFRHGDEILDRATRVRESFDWKRDAPKSQLKDNLQDYDVIICGFNKQRVAINKKYRGTNSPTPVVGDKIICLRNNYDLGVFNGQIFEIVGIRSTSDPQEMRMSLLDDEGDIRHSVPVGLEAFNRVKATPFDYQEYMIADFAYAITAHKAQGSEWDNVAVLYAECNIWSNRRWLYTAMTRAAKTLKVYA